MTKGEYSENARIVDIRGGAATRDTQSTLARATTGVHEAPPGRWVLAGMVIGASLGALVMLLAAAIGQLLATGTVIVALTTTIAAAAAVGTVAGVLLGGIFGGLIGTSQAPANARFDRQQDIGREEDIVDRAA